MRLSRLSADGIKPMRQEMEGEVRREGEKAGQGLGHARERVPSGRLGRGKSAVPSRPPDPVEAQEPSLLRLVYAYS